MKITHDTNVGENRNNKTHRVLNTGARAVGYAFGGKAGAEAAGKIVNSKPVQNLANSIQNKKNKKNPQTNNVNQQSTTPQQTNQNQQNKESDVGSEKLKKSLANRGRNALLNLRKKRKEKTNNDLNGSNSSGNDSGSNTSSLDDGLEKGKEKIAKRIRRAIIRSVIIIALPMLVIIFIIGLAISIIATFFPFLLPSTDSDERVLISEVGTDSYTEESDYYKKLDELKTKYEKQCNKSFNISFIHSTLIYLYYQTDIEEADYKKMAEMVDEVVEEIPDVCNVNYTINGDFYNNLKNNEKYNEYYSVLLTDKSMDEILKNIFDLGSTLDISNDVPSKIYLANDTKINVNKDGEVINSNTTNNNPLTLKEYLAGSVYAIIDDDDLSNNGKVQALTVAITTNLLNGNRLSLSDQILAINYSSNNYCSITLGCSYNERGDLVSGGGKSNSKNRHYYLGKYYYKLPLSSTQMNSLNSSVNSIYGKILTNSSGNYTSLDIDKINNTNGNNYQNIITTVYPELKTSNIIEDNYANDLDYGVSMVKTDVIFYDQNDYTAYSFCNLKKETIKSSGCGITSMAIVVSTYENDKKYDPIYMNKQAINRKQCFSGDGTAIAFFGSQARAMGYKYQRVGKKNSEKNLVLKHLSQGHLVVVHVGPGSFTGGGHYMVLGGVDPSTKKVYVYDPNNRSNSSWRKTGSGWYSFNDIVKQTKSNGFHIIWKG